MSIIIIDKSFFVLFYLYSLVIFFCSLKIYSMSEDPNKMEIIKNYLKDDGIFNDINQILDILFKIEKNGKNYGDRLKNLIIDNIETLKNTDTQHVQQSSIQQSINSPIPQHTQHVQQSINPPMQISQPNEISHGVTPEMLQNIRQSANQSYTLPPIIPNSNVRLPTNSPSVNLPSVNLPSSRNQEYKLPDPYKYSKMREGPLFPKNNPFQARPPTAYPTAPMSMTGGGFFDFLTPSAPNEREQINKKLNDILDKMNELPKIIKETNLDNIKKVVKLILDTLTGEFQQDKIFEEELVVDEKVLTRAKEIGILETPQSGGKKDYYYKYMKYKKKYLEAINKHN